jgi:hypothetical protein
LKALPSDRLEVAEQDVSAGKADVVEEMVVEFHEVLAGALRLDRLAPCLQAYLAQARLEGVAEPGPGSRRTDHRELLACDLECLEPSADRCPVATPKTAQLLRVRRSVPMKPRFGHRFAVFR